MRRPKHPPPVATRELAGIVSDALELGRREEVKDDLARLLPVAIGEYLRLWPTTRNVQDRVWVYRPDYPNQECHFCCYFCRESLVTLPISQGLTRFLLKKVEDHGELCAMAFLAGLVDSVGPDFTNTQTVVRPCAICKTKVFLPDKHCVGCAATIAATKSERAKETKNLLKKLGLR